MKQVGIMLLKTTLQSEDEALKQKGLLVTAGRIFFFFLKSQSIRGIWFACLNLNCVLLIVQSSSQYNFFHFLDLAFKNQPYLCTNTWPYSLL